MLSKHKTYISNYCKRVIDSFTRFCAERLSNKSFAVFLAFITGILAGLFAYLIKLGVDFLTRLFFNSFSIGSSNYQFLFFPTIGILLAYAFQRYVAKQDLGNGTDQISDRLNKKKYYFKPGSALSAVIGATLTLGFGGSAGDEGPSAFSGAAAGNQVGKIFKVNPDTMRLLVACGAGAGIAAIFKAPIGGVLFTLEVLGVELTTLSVIALITSCLVAALTTYVLIGCTPDITMLYQNTLSNDNILYIGLFGLFCGLYSLYYRFTGNQCANILGKFKNNWMKSLIAGTIISIMLFLFPSLYGPGYYSLNEIINLRGAQIAQFSLFAGMADVKSVIVLMALGIILCKGIATYATNYGNGVAGEFAPALFAGGFVGFFYASGLNLLFGLDLSVSNFVYLGMAGALAGIIRAPLMAIFLTAEMTCTFDFLLPATIVSFLSYGLVHLTPNEITKFHQYSAKYFKGKK